MSDDVPQDEPLFAELSEEDIKQLNIDKAKLEFQRVQHISDEVRRECEAEMERGRKSGWKRFKN